MERENLCISFLSWLSSSCCWWHQIKLWLLGKSGVVAWARCSFQLWIFVYSGACNPFCLLPEAGPPSLISGHKWRFPHAHFPSVCVESLPAVDGAGNAQRRVQVLIKPSLCFGKWGLETSESNVQTSKVNFQQLILYDSAQHTLGCKSSSRYESIDYWQTNHPKFIWRFKGSV